MSEIFKDKEGIIEYFLKKCNELLKERDKQPKSKEAVNKTEEKEKNEADYINFASNFIKSVLNYIIIGQNESDEEGSYNPNYEILPELFHEFITFYFKNKVKFDKMFPTLNFNWIYDIFRISNENSKHFKIQLETMNFLIKELNLGICGYEWLESNLLKQNYQQLSEDDQEYFSTLKTLILLVLRCNKRQIRDIKL
jgi:hypothetical protein